MGNVQPLACQQHQQQEQALPIRPFTASPHHSKRPRVVTALLPPPHKPDTTAAALLRATTKVLHATEATPTILCSLILSQDWQRVLCRIALYPTELSHYMAFPVTSNRALLVLPLHLACALNPPSAVVSVMLELFVDAVSMPIRPVATASKKSHRSRWKKTARRLERPTSRAHETTERPLDKQRWRQWQRRYGEWRSFRKGAFPTITCSSDSQGAPESAQPDEDETSVFLSAVEENDSSTGTRNGDDNESPSHISSSQPYAVEKDGHLQLQSSNEDDDPLVRLSPQATDDTCSSRTTIGAMGATTASGFRMCWSLEPLLTHVLSEGSLLALHICCLYSASSKVVQEVARAYPPAALHDIAGMMPIHWVAAGWTLPPLLPEPAIQWPMPTTSPSAVLSDELFLKTLQVLEILQQIVPNSVHVRSSNHGMTPEDYLQECMEESDYKERCLNVVRVTKEDTFESPSNLDLDSHVSLSSREDKVFALTSSEDNDDDDIAGSSRHTQSLTSLLAARDWEGMLVAIETNPSIAASWIYGIDETARTVWKMLPLHLVCEHTDVPIGLVSILLQFYPDAAYAVDPLDGSCPLHIACRSNVALNVLKLLLQKGPAATDIEDADGRLPLHWAVQTSASYQLIEALVAENPHSVSAMDADDQTPMDLAKHVYGQTHMTYELLSMIYHYLNDPTL